MKLFSLTNEGFGMKIVLVLVLVCGMVSTGKADVILKDLFDMMSKERGTSWRGAQILYLLNSVGSGHRILIRL